VTFAEISSIGPKVSPLNDFPKICWSDETYRIFDCEPAIQPTLNLVLERTHPADRHLVHEVIDSATQAAKEFDFEHRLLMPDGSVKYVRVVGRPSTHVESNDLEFVGAVTDITERKRAEEDLQQLVDFVPQYIVVFDADGKLIHANRIAQEYTGLTLDEYRSVDVIGRIIHPDDAERVRALRKRDVMLLNVSAIRSRIANAPSTPSSRRRSRRWPRTSRSPRAVSFAPRHLPSPRS